MEDKEIEDIIKYPEYWQGRMIGFSQAKEVAAEIDEVIKYAANTLETYKIRVKSADEIISNLQRDLDLSMAVRPDIIARDKAEIKEMCCKFFYWWYNQRGNNTEQGFDEWFKLHKQKKG